MSRQNMAKLRFQDHPNSVGSCPVCEARLKAGPSPKREAALLRVEAQAGRRPGTRPFSAG